MASVKGVNITKLDNGTGKINKIEGGGKLEIWTDTYEASSLVAGSNITIARLPKDSAVVDAVVYHDALGASSTLKLGDAGDDDRYLAAGSTASAGALRMELADGALYENTAATDLILTTAGATISGTIKVIIKYLV